MLVESVKTNSVDRCWLTYKLNNTFIKMRYECNILINSDLFSLFDGRKNKNINLSK